MVSKTTLILCCVAVGCASCLLGMLLGRTGNPRRWDF